MARAISKILFIFGPYNFLAYLECVRSYAWSKGHSKPDLSSVKGYLRRKVKDPTAGKAHKAWAFPRFWVSICSYKKKPVKKILGKILGLDWLKFVVASLKV